MTPNPGSLCRDCPHNNHQKSSTDSHREAVCWCDREESVTYLRIDPTTFASDAAAGLGAAHGRLVRSVPGGVVRATATQPGQVAVVIGGGSGHYPAFAGLVGPGLAHGAALGEV